MSEIINSLKLMRTFGFTVVKASSEQIVFNNDTNSVPIVLTNDSEYRTPNPYKWYSIEEEIERIRKERKNE